MKNIGRLCYNSTMKLTVTICLAFLLTAATANAAPDYFSQIGANSLPLGADGHGVVVAVLDSGVDLDHPDLKDNIWTNPGEGLYPDGLDNDNNGYIDDIHGWDFTIPGRNALGQNNPRPKFDGDYSSGESSHGTAIAGYIVAKENILFATAGLAPRAKIMALRVLSANGQGDVDNVVSAINYAVANGANIINLSFVGFDDSDKLRAAVKFAYAHNVVVAAAAGNGNATSTSGINLNYTPAYPVCYGGEETKKILLSVAGVDSNGMKSDFSNYGSNCINISAPGNSLRGLAYSSTTLGEAGFGYAIWSGTSFSAALVSGAAAIIKSIRTDFTANQIINILTQPAKSLAAANFNLAAGQLGAGELAVGSAVNSALAGQSAQLVKVAGVAAVYFVDSNGIRHLFINRQIYGSWFNGWKIPPVINQISQRAFESIPAGANMIVRPGNLVKFNSSPAIYEVLADDSLCQVADSSAGRTLFGKNWQTKIIGLAVAEEANYSRNANCILVSSSTLPIVGVSELIIKK